MNNTIDTKEKDELLSLIDSFMKEKHDRFMQKLSLIETQLKATSSIYEGQDDKVEDICLLFGLVKDELEQHMVKEENLFFPMIRKILENGQKEREEDLQLMERPIENILSEQKRIEVHFAGIRKISNNYEPHTEDAPTLKNCLRELAELEKGIELYFAVERRDLVDKAKTLLGQLNLQK